MFLQQVCELSILVHLLYIYSILVSVDNACCFLTNALEIQEKVGGKCTDTFVDRCIAFIGENATECVKTKGFLKLSKDAIVKIISSDFV